MKRNLIVPDVHNRVREVELLLKNEVYDKAYFVGDFLDDWGDNAGAVATTATALKTWLDQYKCALGNHDQCYGFLERNRENWCPGPDNAKFLAVRRILSRTDFEKFRLHHWIEGETRPWLVSHGGIFGGMFDSSMTIAEVRYSVDALCEEALNCLWDGKTHYLLGCGKIDGGKQNMGGITWLRWSQFQAAPQIHQVVGHTESKEVRWKNVKGSRNACIDTRFRHYVIITGDRLEVKSFKELTEKAA